jgi:predicted HicB family RNase H-like nuclease
MMSGMSVKSGTSKDRARETLEKFTVRLTPTNRKRMHIAAAQDGLKLDALVGQLLDRRDRDMARVANLGASPLHVGQPE